MTGRHDISCGNGQPRTPPQFQPCAVERWDKHKVIPIGVNMTARYPKGMAAAGKSHSALETDPVSGALMSGLWRGVRRWPSWVCACVPGTNLKSVLEAQQLARYCLNCRIGHSLSPHAVQHFLPDQSGLRPAPAILRKGVTRQLAL